MTYAKFLSTPIPQTAPLPNQVANNAGGFSFAVNKWVKLDRFLVLGTEGGTYYVSEHVLTQENATSVLECIQEDGLRVVNRVVEISDAGRAPKNDPAIFVLAMCMSHGNINTRRLAGASLHKVCRTGTHLLHFADYVNKMRGWGRGLRTAIGNWYTEQSASNIAYQAVKYGHRDGWSHKDLLRLSHPNPPTEEHKIVYNWIAKGWPDIGPVPHPNKEVQIIWATERAKVAKGKELINLISDYRLPREVIPTDKLTNPDVWEALLPHMGLTAIIRNLGVMTSLGVISAGNRLSTQYVIDQITDIGNLKKSRIHPVALLSAMLTYSQGHGVRSTKTWQPVTKVVDALDEGFYKSFGNIVPTGKRFMLGLDVSGSMSAGEIAGVPGLTPRVGSAAMALITAATEQDYHIMGFSNRFIPLNISPRQRMDDVIDTISGLPFESTDCSLPMTYALNNRISIDTFVVYTDNETYAGRMHPSEALKQYRKIMGIPAKLVVVGMTATDFTIADPNDTGMMDVVGFDTATPQLISDFAIS